MTVPHMCRNIENIFYTFRQEICYIAMERQIGTTDYVASIGLRDYAEISRHAHIQHRLLVASIPLRIE